MVIYEGPSEIDGAPIVAILTGLSKSSKNSKTGQMPQVWIIRSDIHPTNALKSGQDSSICGECPHRPKVLGDNALKKDSRTCYVKTMAINQVYKKYSTGGYPVVNLEELSTKLTGMNVRIGAYGDPAAVPIEVWDTLLKYCKSTGYTHQWRTCDKKYSEYCVASCDTPLDVVLSTQMGYRTFFVQNVQEFTQVLKVVEGTKFAWCPASKEKGRSTTCSKCMACSGTRFGQKSNVSIMMH